MGFSMAGTYNVVARVFYPANFNCYNGVDHWKSYPAGKANEVCWTTLKNNYLAGWAWI